MGAATKFLKRGLTWGAGIFTIKDEMSKTVKPPKRLLATSRLFGIKTTPEAPKSASYILGA